MTDEEEEYTAEPIGERWDNPWVLGMMAGGLGVLVLTLVGIAFGLVHVAATQTSTRSGR